MNRQAIISLLNSLANSDVKVTNLNEAIVDMKILGKGKCRIVFDAPLRDGVALTENPDKKGEPDKVALVLWVDAEAIPASLRHTAKKTLSIA